MKIALVHPFAWPEVRRGGERYLDDLQWYLRNAGHRVDVITGTRSGGDVVTTPHGANRRLQQLPGLRRGRVQLADVETFGARVVPTLLRHRYDIVHALVPTAAVGARLTGQRVVFTLLGYPTPKLMQEHPMKRRVLTAAVRMSGGVSALSSLVADDVEATFGRRPTVIAPGVRTPSFAPAPRAAVPTILFASAMRPEKGVDVLLRAFATLAASQPDVRLVLCGPGDPTWAFDAAGDAVDPYRDRVDVVGPGLPEELPARYASAHVTVLPSRNEAFGLVLAESLASGTPVVGCSGGGADDIVVDGVGSMVAHGDAPALADAIGKSLELARQPETAGRCLARATTWDWQGAIGPQHEALYETVLAPRRVI